MSDTPRATVARFGYRGRALTLVGLVWVLVGLEVLHSPDATPILSDLLPPWARAAMWLATGAVALVTAWWPPDSDGWGWMALTVPPFVRAFAYGWSALLGLFPGRVGDTGDWVGALAWAAIIAFVLLLSSWPEPVNVNGERP